MSKENHKIFSLETKEDFIIYLSELIILVQMKLTILKRYLEQLEKEIEICGLDQNHNVKISPNVYQEYRDKLMNTQNYLLNLVGDETKTAMSYKKFRKILEKKSKSIGIEFDKLKEELQALIIKANVSRNWSMHVPESLLNAQMEYDTEESGEDIRKFILDNVNPIGIPHYEYYEGKWLLDLYENSKLSYEGTRMIHQQMKKDYSKLIGESVRILPVINEIRTFKQINIPKISMDMQLRKYKKK
ncbi:MAG: hypothetical protein N4A57_02840 [Anaeromicrobium sp.]|jgi:hypothetical protein|uniref:hypothetical protein n=1 Tax=Anaeromicrobium sp. TaxID=1929132 RepID=UPI0025DAC166|nr:hypothetical protein [Anaeromicrobium sp.]MCT4593198.1 hypothetical protein [Anaeromicrobium sp.]